MPKLYVTHAEYAALMSVRVLEGILSDVEINEKYLNVISWVMLNGHPQEVNPSTALALRQEIELVIVPPARRTPCESA